MGALIVDGGGISQDSGRAQWGKVTGQGVADITQGGIKEHEGWVISAPRPPKCSGHHFTLKSSSLNTIAHGTCCERFCLKNIKFG